MENITNEIKKGDFVRLTNDVFFGPFIRNGNSEQIGVVYDVGVVLMRYKSRGEIEIKLERHAMIDFPDFLGVNMMVSCLEKVSREEKERQDVRIEEAKSVLLGLLENKNEDAIGIVKAYFTSHKWEMVHVIQNGLVGNEKQQKNIKGMLAPEFREKRESSSKKLEDNFPNRKEIEDEVRSRMVRNNICMEMMENMVRKIVCIIMRVKETCRVMHIDVVLNVLGLDRGLQVGMWDNDGDVLSFDGELCEYLESKGLSGEDVDALDEDLDEDYEWVAELVGKTGNEESLDDMVDNWIKGMKFRDALDMYM